VSGPRIDASLATRLILDELFDLALYRRLQVTASGDLRHTLEQLIPIETRHVAFWQQFFGIERSRLDLGRRLKLRLVGLACRLFGERAVHLVLEAVEVYGVRKYLTLWDAYKDTPLGGAIREVLEDEFRHEDMVVSEAAERTINPDRIRNVFLGLNDGLVEIVGAVSGFFAAFTSTTTVLAAASTTAVAGALSMAAGAYVASSSAREIRQTEIGKKRFLGEPTELGGREEGALTAAFLVGASYCMGALVPVLPVVFGARSPLLSLLTAGVVLIAVSWILAFLSGMNIPKRVATNVVTMAAAVGVTYAIGTLARALWGIAS
jgi:VIT1/CCC1 family predicted Fe2+/Mn2+ transporter